MKTFKLILILLCACSFAWGQEFNITKSMRTLKFEKSDVYYVRTLSEPWYSCYGKRRRPVIIIQESDLKAAACTSSIDLFKYFRSDQFKWAMHLPEQRRWSPSTSAVLYLKGAKIVLAERMNLVLKCEMSTGKIPITDEANCMRLTAAVYEQLQEAVNWAETGK